MEESLPILDFRTLISNAVILGVLYLCACVKLRIMYIVFFKLSRVCLFHFLSPYVKYEMFFMIISMTAFIFAIVRLKLLQNCFQNLFLHINTRFDNIRFIRLFFYLKMQTSIGYFFNFKCTFHVAIVVAYLHLDVVTSGL